MPDGGNTLKKVGTHRRLGDVVGLGYSVFGGKIAGSWASQNGRSRLIAVIQ